MVICPVCKTENPDGANSCESCSSSFLSASQATVISTDDQQTVLSGPVPLPGSAAAPARAKSTPRDAHGTVHQEEIAPGTMLGSRYLVQAEAGEGGMGKVYRAADLDLNRTVAIKLVRYELASDPKTLERLKQEILLASRISHRHVLRIHDLAEADGLRFITMAWIDGEDLERLIRRTGPLSEERLMQLATQICEGLEAAHQEGIVHRDLKPHNILIDQRGNAFISDFGLAQTLDISAAATLSRAGQVTGTPRYMSPEQVEGKTVDHRTDIYSLGLILYEMATGTLPFKGDSVLETMVQRITQPAKNPKLERPELSVKLASIIMRCLERDPAKRFQTAAEVLCELRSEKPAPSTSSRALRKNWVLAIAAAILLFAAIAIPFAIHRKTVETPRPPRNGKYVAVLPFRTLGSDPSLKYGAEGIGEAISSRLFSLKAVHPISPNAVQQVSTDQPIDTIAAKLGANLIVQGAIQGDKDRIAVIVNVDDTETHKRVWSQTFYGLQADLLTLEDEISAELVKGLDVTPTPAERERQLVQPTENIEAYDTYLKGRDILKNHREAEGTTQALKLFEQACEQDSSFALAWAGVADASLQMYRLTHESFYAEKALAAAREAANRNGMLPEVHFALGSVYTAVGRNAQAVDEIKHALTLAPNSDDGYRRLGKVYLATGQSEAAVDAYKKAVELNPYYWFNHQQLGIAYSQLGKNEEALRAFKREVELNSEDSTGYNLIGAIYFVEGRWKESIPAFQKALAIKQTPDAYSNLGTAYFYLGRYSEAIPLFERAVELDPNDILRQGNLGDAYRQAGDIAKAHAAYGRAISIAYRQLEVNPKDADALGKLALYYAKEGKDAEARQFIRRARAIDAANNQLMYFEAVVNALGGHNSEAIPALQRALENGYSSLEQINNDVDLKSLRATPEFQVMLKRLKHQTEAPRR